MIKKIELKTFTNLTTDNKIKVALSFIGVLALLMIGISSLSGKLNMTSIGIAFLSLGGGAWLGKTGYDILIDPKSAKRCNASYWTVTENVGYDPDDYDTNDLDITLCEAQLKAQYEGDYAGFFCTSNTAVSPSLSPSPTGRVDVFYIKMSDSKKLNLKQSGTSNVFTIKTGDNKIRVTEPPGTFTLTLSNGLLLTGSNFDRIDDTQSIRINFGSSSPSPSPPAGIINTVANLRTGIQLQNGNFNSVTVTAVSKTVPDTPVVRTVTRS